MGARTINYTATQGIPFKRLLVLKSKRRHRRLMVPTEVKAQIQTTSTSKRKLTTEITGAGEILLTLTAAETAELPIGELQYDVLAKLNDTYYRVSAGVITVEANNTVTDGNEAQSMELRMSQHEDFRKTFTWKDKNGVLQAVSNAYLQAVDSDETTTLDLRWYSTVPDEATIIALAGERRGYLAPKAGATLEMHISDKNTIPAGNHTFDLFVQDSAGDWERISSGTIVVDASVATNPYA
jgi:hypothetical protein